MVLENGISGFKELKPATVVGDLISFIRSEISEYKLSDEFTDILELKKNENQHTLSFCVFMTNKCNSKYYFARENSQFGSSVIDIGIYRGSVLVFTIEAKILPTPPGTSQNPRLVHEYVYGNGAGIQRFKDGKHGVDNLNNPLNDSGLIGFLKSNTCEHWFQEINGWMKNANWAAEENLKPIEDSDYSFLMSRHTRVSSEPINLYHFLIDVSNCN